MPFEQTPKPQIVLHDSHFLQRSQPCVFCSEQGRTPVFSSWTISGHFCIWESYCKGTVHSKGMWKTKPFGLILQGRKGDCEVPHGMEDGCGICKEPRGQAVNALAGSGLEEVTWGAKCLPQLCEHSQGGSAQHHSILPGKPRSRKMRGEES